MKPEDAGTSGEKSKDEDEGEIDGGTVIRRRPAQTHQRLPASWDSPGNKTKGKGKRRQNKESSQATDESDAQSRRTGTSHDSSPEYLPALAYQPEERRGPSGEQAAVRQVSGESSGMQTSSSKSQPQNTPTSSEQGHDSQVSDVNAKPVEVTDHSGSSSSAREATPESEQDVKCTGDNSGATQDQHEDQQNRERQITVVYSPLPIPSTAAAAAPNTDAPSQSAGPSTPPGSPDVPGWQPSVHEWLATAQSLSGQPADSSAFSDQFKEVEAAHRQLEMDTHRHPKKKNKGKAGSAAGNTATHTHPSAVLPTVPRMDLPTLPKTSNHPPAAAPSPSPIMRSSTVPASLRPHTSGANTSVANTLEPFPAYADPMTAVNSSIGSPRRGRHQAPRPQKFQFPVNAAGKLRGANDTQAASPSSSGFSPLNPRAKEFKSTSAAPSVAGSPKPAAADQTPIAADDAAKPKTSGGKKKKQNKGKNAAKDEAKGETKTVAKDIAKDDSKKTDGSVSQNTTGDKSSVQPDTTKTAPSGSENVNPNKGRGRPNITVAIPLNFSKMQPKGKAPARPQQPQKQQSGSSSSTPSKNNKKDRSGSQQQTPSQSPPPPKTPKKQPAPATPPTTTAQSQSQSQWSTPTPSRVSLESTMPVLTSSDCPHLQTIEPRPADSPLMPNAWAQGPPKLLSRASPSPGSGSNASSPPKQSGSF